MEDFVSGIVSYGMGCDMGVPDAYTNVHYFLEWIEKNLAHKSIATEYFSVYFVLLHILYVLCL